MRRRFVIRRTLCFSTTLLLLCCASGTLGAQTGTMVTVPGGTFTMGSPTGETRRFADEAQHTVTLTGFLLSRYETTVGEFRAFIEATGYQTTAELKKLSTWRNPGFTQTETDPVVEVSWYDAVAYCNWRSAQEGLRPAYLYSGKGADFMSWPLGWNTETQNEIQRDSDSNGYRLPTEAEWEYAARQSSFGPSDRVYPGSDSPDGVGWYWPNSNQHTHPVGQKKANGIGLFDMSGNAWEWCGDWYADYGAGTQSDPRGPSSGAYRVIRGGSWLDSFEYLRVACRARATPWSTRTGYGFRLCRSLDR